MTFYLLNTDIKILTFFFQAVKDGLSTIYIQENVREIENVTLTTTDFSLTPVQLDEDNPFERIRAHHFLKINLAGNTTLVNGEDYILTISYIGNINETPLQRGVFRGHYKDNTGRV